MNSRTKNIVAIYILAAIAIVVHFSVLLNDIINWYDDELFLLLNAIQNGSETIFSQRQYSLAVMFWFWIQYLIGENGYFIYHAVSILLHVLNAVLLFFVLLRLRLSFVIAFATSFIFVIHPFGVESVAIINNQPVLLSLAMILLTLLFYMEFIERGKRYFQYSAIVSAIIFYSLGNPAFVLIIGLLGCSVIQQKKIESKNIVPFFFVWVIALSIEVWNSNVLTYVSALFTESISLLRIGYGESAMRIFFPGTQPLLVNSNLLLTQHLNAVSIAYPLSFASLVIFAVLRRKIFPILFFGLGIALLSSLPVFTGIVKGEWLFSESTFYISSIGWYLIVVRIVEKNIRSLDNNKSIKYFYFSLSFLLVTSLMYQTHTKATYWKNGEKFWEKCIEDDPENIFALIKRGMYYNSKFEIHLALLSLNKAIEILPDNVTAILSRGIVNFQAMNLNEATNDFKSVIRLDSVSGRAYYGIGSIHNLYSRYDSAIIAFTSAIKFSPKFHEGYNSRANAYGKIGNVVLALADYKKAIELNPKNAEIYGNRALLFLQIGNAEDALKDFTRQIEIEPMQFYSRIHAGLTAIKLKQTLLASLHISNAFAIDSLKANIYLNAVVGTFLQRNSEVLELESVLLKDNLGVLVSEKK